VFLAQKKFESARWALGGEIGFVTDQSIYNYVYIKKKYILLGF
jgi:hypothetical protein